MDRTGILIILDGLGINKDTRHNAVALAKAPTLSALFTDFPHTELQASEHHVGLPAGFMGNSEVGHLNIGAGRVVYQDLSLISHAIEDGSFFRNRVLVDFFGNLKAAPKATLHLMGLVSDGGVHSHLSHLFALVRLAKEQGLRRVAIHVFTDGRDTSPTSGRAYLDRLQGFLSDTGVGEVVTICGRFFAMDRDSRWERTARAYQALVLGSSEAKFKSAADYLEDRYANRVTDEFIEPACRTGYGGILDGDGILFFNFRADRARQLTRSITQTEFDSFARQRLPTLRGLVTLTSYEDKSNLPAAFEKPKISGTLGEWISRQGWKQLRVAETEKYAHVTYFFNGGQEKAFEGEKRVLVPSSRDVRTYDLKPEMGAREITEALLKELSSGIFRFAVVNFANPDMVGHTGSLKAAMRAVEVVDECLGKILGWVKEHGAFLVVTADHGNCEKMVDDDGTPMTSHTLLPVPFVLVDFIRKDLRTESGGSLSDIAPTLCRLFDRKPPVEMTGRCLISDM